MRIPIKRYTRFIAALYDADKADIAQSILLMSSGDSRSSEMVTPDTPEALALLRPFVRFGNITDFQQLAVALRTRPETIILDGTEPIEISSDIANFGKYDADISPILDSIIKKVRIKAEGNRWKIVLTFEPLNTLKKCNINGTIFTGEDMPNSNRRARNETFKGVVVGATVKDCVTYAEEVIPQMIG